MNKVNENTMKMENLELAAKVRCEEYQKVRGSLSEEIGKVLNRYIAQSGVTGYAANFPEWCHDLENLRVSKNGDNWHEITLNFRRDYDFAERDYKKRVLELNPSSFGSFKRDDFEKIAYYALNGYLALHLGEIEDELVALDWASFDKAREALRYANREVENLKQSIESEEFHRRFNEAEGRLVVGATLVVGYTKRWNYDTHEFDVTTAEKKVVEKTTAKLVWFKNDWKQYKKADVVSKLTVGIDKEGKKNGWAFAEDVGEAAVAAEAK